MCSLRTGPLSKKPTRFFLSDGLCSQFCPIVGPLEDTRPNLQRGNPIRPEAHMWSKITPFHLATKNARVIEDISMEALVQLIKAGDLGSCLWTGHEAGDNDAIWSGRASAS